MIAINEVGKLPQFHEGKFFILTIVDLPNLTNLPVDTFQPPKYIQGPCKYFIVQQKHIREMRNLLRKMRRGTQK